MENRPLYEGAKVIYHVRTSCEVDKALRDRAAHDASKPAPRYWFLGRNCWAYADGFVDEARRRMGYGPRAPLKFALAPADPDFPPVPKYPLPKHRRGGHSEGL